MTHPIRSLSDDQLAAALERLRARYPVDYPDLKPREVLSDCIAELGGLFACQSAVNTIPRRFFFFRVRPAHTFQNLDEASDPGQYTYPPARVCRLGRANLSSNPVFYGSDSIDGAIMEMKTQQTNKYFLSIWHTDETQIDRLNFLFANNIRAPRLIKNAEQVIQGIWKKYSDYDDFNKSRIRSHLCAWSDLFISDSHALTASIAHCNLYGDYQKFDVICYGSAIDGSYVNHAIHPRLADKLTLYKVYEVTGPDENGRFLYHQFARP